MQQNYKTHNLCHFLAAILIFSLFIRLLVGIGYFNSFDTYWYRKWALDLPNGLFDIYSRASIISLDYPPIYLFFLYPIGLIYKHIGTDANNYIQMLLMKFWPMIFDVLCSFLLYRVCRKISEIAGLTAAVLWAFNPSTLFNSSMWGQTDSIMAFLLILAFWILSGDKPMLACIIFALAGLTKFQSLFFTPVFLLQLWNQTNLKRFIYGMGCAAATVAAIFLPFMIGARNIKLFSDVYLGSAGKYAYCTFNAYNFYGIFSLNTVNDCTSIIGGFTFAHLSYIFTVLSLFLIIFLYIKGNRHCAWVGGLLFMECLFMFMSRMHERYQIIVLPFALMAYILHKNRDFFYIFVSISLINSINQAIILFRLNDSSNLLKNVSAELMVVFSIINLFIFIWTAIVCINFFMSKELPEDCYDQ